MELVKVLLRNRVRMPNSISILNMSRNRRPRRRCMKAWAITSSKKKNTLKTSFQCFNNEKYRHSFHAYGYNNHFLVDAIIIILIFSKLKLNLFVWLLFCYCYSFSLLFLFLRYEHRHSIRTCSQSVLANRHTIVQTEWHTHTHTQRKWVSRMLLPLLIFCCFIMLKKSILNTRCSALKTDAKNQKVNNTICNNFRQPCVCVLLFLSSHS